MKDTAALRRRIISRRARIAVLGQGYVGLTAACAAADAGFTVTGIDADGERIRDLQSGVPSVPGVGEDEFLAALQTGRLSFSEDPGPIRASDVVLICVPTTMRDHTPDLTHVRVACESLAGRLTRARLVVLESTTYPGTTDELVRPILESSGLAAGRDFLLAYSPERIDPGNDEFGFRNTPRIVGGVTPEATGMAVLLYEQMVDKVIPVSSCRSAELAKLLENTFRHVNVALVNEMAMLCHEVEIDVWEVIEAAASKPFGFTAFHPGPGVGGDSIPFDSTHLAWQVRRDAGHQFRLLELAQDINARMPGYVAARIGDALNDVGRAVKGASILVLGVAYKSDIDDMRESPSLQVMNALDRKGARVSFHDPYIAAAPLNGTMLPRVELTRHTVESADCVAVLTPHSTYDLDWVAQHASLLFDARNAFGPDRLRNVVSL